MLGFSFARVISGDMLTRGLGGPPCRINPPCLRWCAGCKAIWRWSHPQGWNDRDCAWCQFRGEVSRRFAHLARLTHHFCYQSIEGVPSHITGTPWSVYIPLLRAASITPEEFQLGNEAELRRLWLSVANQVLELRGAA